MKEEDREKERERRGRTCSLSALRSSASSRPPHRQCAPSGGGGSSGGLCTWRSRPRAPPERQQHADRRSNGREQKAAAEHRSGGMDVGGRRGRSGRDVIPRT